MKFFFRGALLALLACFLVASLAAQSKHWYRGQFGEIVTGKSKAADIIRMYGPSEPQSGKEIDIYRYPGRAEFNGDLIFEVSHSTGVVEAVIEQWSPNITRTSAYKKYGRQYNEVLYSVSPCPHEGVNPNVYRDPKGTIELIEMPQLGLVLWPNAYGFDFAEAVYLPKPLPSAKPTCREANAKP